MRFGSILLATLFLPVIGFAATIYVPDNYPTIQGAIDASANGDTVIVRPGTYVENIDFVGKAITLESEMGVAATIIDGNEAGSVVRFSSGEGAGSVLDGFTVTNGTGSVDPWGSFLGGGIYCDASSPTITNNSVEGNKADDGSGGGIYCYDSSPTITDNKIVRNWSFTGSGIYCFNSSPIIAGNTIANNFFSVYGGGIYCDSSSPDIRDNIIWENLSLYTGSGIYCVGPSSPNIAKNLIAQNYGGSGIMCADSSSPVIANNIIAGHGDRSGGGICCHLSSSPSIDKNEIFGNSAECGGGISCGSSSATITNNVISDNSASFYGGGIYCGGSTPTIANNIISGNSTSFAGGGISVWNGSPAIINNTISGNDSLYLGGGIYCHQSSSPSITNNTIVGNSAYDSGGGIQSADSSSPTVTNTIFWNNSAALGPEIYLGYLSPSTLTISFSDVEGGQSSCHVESGCALNWGSAMIDADPLFVDPANDDFHLTWDSPCGDGGDNTAVTEQYDFEGDPRIAFGTVDIGADEYYYHLYHVGDVVPGSAIDLKVVGYPGAGVTLFLGTGIADTPYSTQHGDFWLNWPPLWRGTIGTVPQNGIIVHATTVPAWWASGSEHPFQTLVGPWGGGATMLTNPMILDVE